MVSDTTIPKPHTTKTVVIQNLSVNIIWYLLHLPLIAYLIYVLAFQLEHTIVVDNSPFLQLNVDVVNNAPYMNATQDLPPDIAQYCSMAGGPFPCRNSTPEVYQQCVSLLNEDIVTNLDLLLMRACTRPCPIWNDMSCFAAPSNVMVDGSFTVELTSFKSFNTGGVSMGGVDQSNNFLWVLMNHLVSEVPMELTYSFRLSQDPPYFFGMDPHVADRKTQQDSHTIAVSRSGRVLFSFGPGEKIIIKPPGLLAMAGWDWNLNALLQGGEFSAGVNCYNFAFDLPSLDWSGHSQIVPTTRAPLCLVSVEALRSTSLNTFTDLATGTSSVNVHLRFDTRRGDSYFRLPSLANLILSLIQCIILLGVPTAVAGFFATNCLGCTSTIIKKASLEFFYIGFRMPSAGLRLASDSLALAHLSSGQDTIETSAMQKELYHILADKVAHPNLQQLAEDMVAHISQQNQKVQGLANSNSPQEVGSSLQPSDLADLLYLGQRPRAREVAKFFDRHRRRTCLEWAVLPKFHREELARLRNKAAQRSSVAACPPGAEKPALMSRLSSRLSAIRPPPPEEVSEEEEEPPSQKELLQQAIGDAKSELQELKEEIDCLNERNGNKPKDQDRKRQQKTDQRLADIRQMLQALTSAEERLDAKVASTKSHHKDLMQAFDRKATLERRLGEAAKGRARLLQKLSAFRERVSFRPFPALPDHLEEPCTIEL